MTADQSTATRRLFGTDGVRGNADALLTDEFARRLGRAAAEVLGDKGAQMAILRDTRESGERIEVALASGATAAGVDVKLAGVLPTPAAPILIDRHGFDLVAVVSASHNPYEDNGIKFFGRGGMKLGDDVELAIETALEAASAAEEVSRGSASPLAGAEDDYVAALLERFSALALGGKRIALDTANGATYRVAPRVMRELGADVTVIHNAPNGRNINAGCGSTEIESLRSIVADGDFEIGFAFDGDGDRVLTVDTNGRVVDGDEMIAIAALHMRDAGRLPGGGVVVTVMTNYGFHTAMAEAGIDVAVAQVGDRYVLEELLARDWALGGEQSGHVIDLGFAPSGDGTASALLLLEALSARGAAMHDVHAMEKLPQTLVNVRVKDRDEIDSAAGLWQAVERADAALEGRGRVLVRSSGTEPLVRVMVEAPTADEAERVSADLAQVVERELG